MDETAVKCIFQVCVFAKTPVFVRHKQLKRCEKRREGLRESLQNETGSSLYSTILCYRSRQIAGFAAPNKRQPPDRQLATAKRQPTDRQLVYY